MTKKMTIWSTNGKSLTEVEGKDAFEPNMPALRRRHPDAAYLEFEVWNGGWVTVAIVYLTSEF